MEVPWCHPTPLPNLGAQGHGHGFWLIPGVTWPNWEWDGDWEQEWDRDREQEQDGDLEQLLELKAEPSLLPALGFAAFISYSFSQLIFPKLPPVPAGLVPQSRCLLPTADLPDEVWQLHARPSRCVSAERAHACQMCPRTPPAPRSSCPQHGGGETRLLPLAPRAPHPPPGTVVASWCTSQPQISGQRQLQFLPELSQGRYWWSGLSHSTWNASRGKLS